jgi:hypothetical protein
MEWAMITWGILLGMVGLLWVMAIAVMQEEPGDKGSEDSADASNDAFAGPPKRESHAA